MRDESTSRAVSQAVSQLSGHGVESLPAAYDSPLQDVLSAVGVGIIAADVHGLVIFVNLVGVRLIGFERDDLLGRPLDHAFRLSGEAHPNGFLPPEPEQLSEGPLRREEAALKTAAGNTFPIEFSVASIVNDLGRADGLVIAFRSISDQRLMELHLQRVSRFDLLTGLLNRAGFLDHLGRARAQCLAGRESWILCFLDIDHFKLINDTCDHVAGDELLLWVAELLRELVGERDLVARLGGDEFALLVRRESLEEGVRFAEQVQARLQEFLFSWEDKSFTVSASIGIAWVGAEFANAAHLLSAADHACYMAKEKGRNGLQVYEAGDVEVSQARDEMEWMARINHKLDSGQIVLYAQPIRPLSPMAMRGLQFEVLIRMVDADGTIHTPAKLVHAAERYGLMPVVDRWVVNSVLQSLCGIDSEQLTRVQLCCINLSGLSLRDGPLMDSILGSLSDTGVPPQKLCFEITETAAVENLDQAKWLIRELGSLGCNLALDDFGTGMASYRYLKELRVDYLKVAGSFVEGLITSDLDRAMVESINQISHLMGIETIAEHVGSRDLFDRVRAIGIDHAQGFWIGMPRPFAETCTPHV